VSILVGNMQGPFVSRKFAERLALLVIQERYTPDVFLPRGAPPIVVDKGDFWSVTFDNELPRSSTSIIPKELTIHIRKANGEIVAIS